MIKENYVIDDIPDGEYTLKASYVGYKSFVIRSLSGWRHIYEDINLGESLLSLEGVEINATRVDENSAICLIPTLDREDIEE